MFSRALLLLWAVAFATRCVAAPLSLGEAVRLAVSNQPILSGQRAAVDAARQNGIADSQLPDPKLKVGVSNVPTDTFSLSRDSMTQETVAIEQTIPGGDKLRLKGRKGEAEAEQGEAELDTARRTVERDAGLSWLDLYYALKAQTLVRDLLRSYRQQTEAATIDYETGKATQQAVLKLKGESALLQDRLDDLRAQVERARAGLARWIGKDAGRDLPGSLPPPEKREPSLEALRLGLSTHPRIVALNKAEAVAASDVALARQAYKPDWSVELGYSRRGPSYADMVSLQVGVDLPLFPKNRQDRALASKLALLDKTRDLEMDGLRVLNAELMSDYAERQAARSRIARYRTTIIPLAEQRVSAALIDYRTGRADLSGVLEARRAQLDARLQSLALEVAQAKAQVRLDYFVESGREGGQ